MRRTLRKKGISLFSPPLVRFSSTRVLPLLCFFIHTHARRKRKQKRRYRRVCVYIEVRQNTKSGFFAWFAREREYRHSAREEEEKSTTEINGQKSHPKESAFLSLFFHIKP